MLIEFRCTNYSKFDQNTGQYVVCGQRLSAGTEDAGLIVSCPRCNHDCEVPFPETDSARQAAGLGDKASRQRGSAVQRPQSTSQTKLTRCPKCGGNLDSRGVCTACRWVQQRFAKAKMSLDEMPMEPAGMMLWLSHILSEGMPLKMMCHLANVIVPSLLVALMAFSLFAAGGLLGGFLFLVFFCCLVLYIALVYKAFQFLRDGNARLAWFQRPFWFGLLGYMRSRKWKGFDSRTLNRNVVDYLGQPITDEKLIEIAPLKSAQILDLEGTLITDDTLDRLYDLKHLQCLVVCNTKVTHLAVTRLQQSFPKLWIWH